MSTYLKIGEFAEMAEVSPRALRIYESHGLIRSHTRGENGYRYYAKSQLESIKRITKLKSFGFSLREIRALLLSDLSIDSKRLKDFVQTRIDALIQQEAEIISQKRQLFSVLTSLDQEQSALCANDRRYIMKFFETVLPFISVRDLVLFPGNKMTIYIGRTFTKSAIEESMLKHGGQIVIATQKAVEMNDKPDPEQIFELGCLCQINSKTESADGVIKIDVIAKARWHIIDLDDRNGVRFCEGAEVPFPRDVKFGAGPREEIHKALRNRTGIEDDDTLIELLFNVADPFQFICEIGGRLPQILKQPLGDSSATIGQTPFLIDTWSAEELCQVNLNLARVQEILAEDDLTEACKKITFCLNQNTDQRRVTP